MADSEGREGEGDKPHRHPGAIIAIISSIGWGKRELVSIGKVEREGEGEEKREREWHKAAAKSRVGTCPVRANRGREERGPKRGGGGGGGSRMPLAIFQRPSLSLLCFCTHSSSSSLGPYNSTSILYGVLDDVSRT